MILEIKWSTVYTFIMFLSLLGIMKRMKDDLVLTLVPFVVCLFRPQLVFLKSVWMR